MPRKKKITITYDSKVIAENLERALRARGLSVMKLSEMVGVSDTLIHQILDGERNVSASVLAKIALALGVSADELLGLRPSDAEVRRLEEDRDRLQHEAARIAASFSELDASARDSALDRLQEIHEAIADIEFRLRRAREFARSRDSGTLILPVLGDPEPLVLKADCAARPAGDAPAGSLVLIRRRAGSGGEARGPYAVKRDGGVEVRAEPSGEVLGEVVGYLLPAPTV